MGVNYKYFAAIFLMAVFSISSVANAALVSRLGGLAYYDDVADLTWLADANAAVGSVYDIDELVRGIMTWDQANAWAASLNVGGVGGWRLPDSDTCNGSNCTGSEMGNLFYNVLGGSAGVSLTTAHNNNYNLFSNIQPLSFFSYWSATEYEGNDTFSWTFDIDDGSQEIASKDYTYYAWAVHSGDVSAVPVPAAVWLFGSGLLGLIGIAKRKKEV